MTTMEINLFGYKWTIVSRQQCSTSRELELLAQDWSKALQKVMKHRLCIPQEATTDWPQAAALSGATRRMEQKIKCRQCQECRCWPVLSAEDFHGEVSCLSCGQVHQLREWWATRDYNYQDVLWWFEHYQLSVPRRLVVHGEGRGRAQEGVTPAGKGRMGEAAKPVGTRDVDKFLKEQQDDLWKGVFG